MAHGFKIPDQDSVAANRHALKVGYRHFDSARMYDSEKNCGDAIRQSGLKREEVFVTTKVFQTDYQSTKDTIETSLKESGLGFYDLVLNHAPFGGAEARKGTWRAFVEAQQEGKIRSMGVSNYGVHHLDETEAYIQELEAQHGTGKGGEISVGQWELHPWLTRPDIVQWCQKRGVVIEAYCPLVRQQRFGEPVLKSLAEKYNKTEGQVLIRWSLQKVRHASQSTFQIGPHTRPSQGFVPLPKSVTPSRIEGNADVYDFALTDEEMAQLTTNDYSPCTWDPTVSKD